MAKKRKKATNYKLVKILLFLLVISTICLFHQPLSGVLQNMLQAKENKVVVATKVEKKQSTKSLEIPAPLSNRPEQILRRKGYTTSYNQKWKMPNWVAWELTSEELQVRESRTNEFLPDPDIPESQAVTTNDYKGSGYDRGHMCPAGDNRWHWKAMQESFYMTNMCPQNRKLNGGDWRKLEEKCRDWAKQAGSIYIVCGPIVTSKNPEKIGRHHRITVPDAFFKVILSMNGDTPSALGFIYQNKAESHPLNSYLHPIDQVEQLTGIDFFPSLPDDIEDKVEANSDINQFIRSF